MAERLPRVAPLPNPWRRAEDPDAFYQGAMNIANSAPTPQLCKLIRDRIHKQLNGRVRDLDVETTAAGIVISGTCSTYHTKQLAQHAALGVLNDEALQNRIEVTTP